jgi:hypothetical protein
MAEEFVGCVRGWQTEASFFRVNRKVLAFFPVVFEVADLFQVTVNLVDSPCDP